MKIEPGGAQDYLWMILLTSYVDKLIVYSWDGEVLPKKSIRHFSREFPKGPIPPLVEEYKLDQGQMVSI